MLKHGMSFDSFHHIKYILQLKLIGIQELYGILWCMPQPSKITSVSDFYFVLLQTGCI